MKNLLYFFIILLFCLSCSKKTVEKSTINETNLELQMIEAYNEGLEELKAGDVLFAAKKFNEAEILFPQSEVAPRAALMAAYSYWTQAYYSSSISELKRVGGFPDDFKLAGSFSQKWERIGRAVPPIMMASIAKTIHRDILSKI